MAIAIDGKKIAAEAKQHIKKWIERDLKRAPTLAIISIGDDDASKVYMRNKIKAAEEVGIEAKQFNFNQEQYYDTYEFNYLINQIICNHDGIILQLPVPSWCNAHDIIDKIPFWKDVDGLTAENMGRLRETDRNIMDAITPCTPSGIMEILGNIPTALEGKHAVAIGRSNLVGRPIAEMLLQNNMTVTICHSKTPKDELLRYFATADLVISAAGQKDLITEWDALQYSKDYRHDFYNDFAVKKNRVIIDVSINRDENGKLCGDFSEEFKQKYSEYYTPVPGGVGPMTVAMLMYNTYRAAKDGEFWERWQKKRMEVLY